jgi:hypothetical protein
LVSTLFRKNLVTGLESPTLAREERSRSKG